MSRKQATISSLLAVVIVLASTTGMVIAQSQTTCPAGYTAYTVQRGDWIFKIARAFGVSPQAIINANSPIGGLNPNLIYPGQVLCIPPKTASTATATTGPTRTPAPTATPVATRVPGYICCPSFRIVSVVRDTSVTIETKNFPAGLKFDVRMAARGAQAVGGTIAGTQDSGTGGVFRATYTIPAGLKGLGQIAIRLEHPTTGYNAFNWFWNSTVTAP
ncbi:MAG: LysM peptidoglycan-binding domain-containing protein [Anaerolineales bacterium]